MSILDKDNNGVEVPTVCTTVKIEDNFIEYVLVSGDPIMTKFADTSKLKPV